MRSITTLVLPALLLGCFGSPKIKEDFRFVRTSGSHSTWLPAGATRSAFASATSRGQIPEGKPVTLFLRPLDLSLEVATGESCEAIRRQLATWKAPIWTPSEGSRVRRVDREADAEWVLEARIQSLQIQVGMHTEPLELPVPTAHRSFDSEAWLRLRDRRSGNPLWWCISRVPPEKGALGSGPQQADLESQLAQHLHQLQKPLNAALNVAPRLG